MKIKGLKIIIGVIIFLIIILILTILLININKDKPTPNIENELMKEANKEEYKLKNSLQEFDDNNMYFVVKNSIERFYSTCREMNATVKDVYIRASAYEGEELQQYKEELAKEMQNKAIEDAYNMLSEDYIKEFNIDKQIIKKKFGLENKYEPIIEKIYSFQNSSNVWTYLITGIIVDNTNNNFERYSIGITVDIYNKTFCIYPQEYIKKHGYDKLQLGDEIEQDISEIKNNMVNTYTYEMVNDDEICKEYFKKTKKIILYDTDFSYEMLDEEYRKKRFNSLEDYKGWVKKYYEILNSSIESKYQVTSENGKKTYICQDTNGSYYIFNKKDTVDFTIRLDTYTIDTNEFMDKYNKENEKTKAEMNIEKIFEAINKKDYKYVYNYLDESFKTNNYPNVESLETYFEDNLFEINSIESNGYKNEGNIQMFNIVVSDKNNNDRSKNMTIIIKIKENTDFVMSFNIQ